MPTPLDRFFEAAGCRTQVELAVFLGIKQSSIADAKKRGSIPADWLITLWRKKGVNPDWILTGQGAKGLQSVESNKVLESTKVYIRVIQPPQECTTDELVGEIMRRAAKSMGLSKQDEQVVKDLLFGDQSESSQ